MLERIVGETIILRKPRRSDAPDIYDYCKDRDFAKTTLRVPQPYQRKDAVEYVRHMLKNWRSQTSYTYVIEYEGKVVGSIGLRLDGHKASIGYGVGKKYWGKGIATEATKLIIDEGFRSLKLKRIYAHHWVKNPASGRVMQKAGMTYEGILRAEEKKGNVFWDTCVYSILKEEWKG